MKRPWANFHLAIVFSLLGATAALADVTAVTGQAFGYHGDDITIFGSAPSDTGPTPTVSLAADASNSPQSATATSGLVTVGPAQLFSSDAITVSTSGALGPGGSVTSTSDLDNVGKTATSTGDLVLADNVLGSCTAGEGGVSGATTITNGTVMTDSGFDSNGDDDYDDPGEHPPVVVPVPTNPAPNTTFLAHLHTGSNVSDVDTISIIFNEQVVSPDGSLRVNAIHEDYQGPTVLGDVYIGTVVCGVAATASPTATETPPNPTSTPTSTPTNTPVDTPTSTPTNTPTNTPVDTPTSTPTNTPTNTPTATVTQTPNVTPTATRTQTPPTPTPPRTPTPTPEPVLCHGLPATLVGTTGDDEIVGTDDNDIIHGLAGNDFIKGRLGDDVICGGAGDDVLRGNKGDDVIQGSKGNDEVRGGRGRDVLRGNKGDDFLDGGDDDDVCDGHSGVNVLENCEVAIPREADVVEP